MTSASLAERRNPELAALAAENGLSVAGARPPLLKYVTETWRYRHFTNAFSTAGVVSALGHHRLGRLWQVLTPLTNAAVYYLIFGVIIGTSRGVHNFIAYLCIGVFFFTYTSQAVGQGVQAITKNLGMIRALQFPRAALPISSTLTQLQNLLASLIVLIAIVLITGEPVRWNWLLLIPLLLLQTMFNVGLSMFVARVGNKITDLKQILPFVMRTWMYASGVMYPATSFAKHLSPPIIAHLAMANPLVVMVEIARQALLPTAPAIMPTERLWVLAVAWAVIVGIGGFIYFWKGEQEYGRG
jgi:teichoic acid transport system permease protein